MGSQVPADSVCNVHLHLHACVLPYAFGPTFGGACCRCMSHAGDICRRPARRRAAAAAAAAAVAAVAAAAGDSVAMARVRQQAQAGSMPYRPYHTETQAVTVALQSNPAHHSLLPNPGHPHTPSCTHTVRRRRRRLAASRHPYDIPCPSTLAANLVNTHPSSCTHTPTPIAVLAGGGAGWLLTAAVVLKAALGVGVLSLPGAFARLGWLPGAAALAALTAAVMYSGSLYTRYGSTAGGMGDPPRVCVHVC